MEPTTAVDLPPRLCRYHCGNVATHFCAECGYGYYCDACAKRHDLIVSWNGGSVFCRPIGEPSLPPQQTVDNRT